MSPLEMSKSWAEVPEHEQRYSRFNRDDPRFLTDAFLRPESRRRRRQRARLVCLPPRHEINEACDISIVSLALRYLFAMLTSHITVVHTVLDLLLSSLCT